MVVEEKPFVKIVEWSRLGHKSLEEDLRAFLANIFRLPKASAIASVEPNDLAVDISVTGCRTGEGAILSLGDMGIPLGWRPRVQIDARLYEVGSGLEVKTIQVVEEPSWREYWASALSTRNVWRTGPLFGLQEIEVILNRASIRLMKQLVEVVSKLPS